MASLFTPLYLRCRYDDRRTHRAFFDASHILFGHVCVTCFVLSAAKCCRRRFRSASATARSRQRSRRSRRSESRRLKRPSRRAGVMVCLGLVLGSSCSCSCCLALSCLALPCLALPWPQSAGWRCFAILSDTERDLDVFVPCPALCAVWHLSLIHI